MHINMLSADHKPLYYSGSSDSSHHFNPSPAEIEKRYDDGLYEPPDCCIL